MTDRLLFDLPNPAPILIPTPSALPPLYDESLFLHASARWRESSEGLRELLAASPGMRDTLTQLLKQKLDLAGQQAGLLFVATQEHPQRFVSFTDACAFVLQHPTLETTLDECCQVTGLNQTHPLSNLTPLQMLERLKTLNPEQSHRERWATYWNTRAPNTAVSRKQRAIQLYRHHFEASIQLAFAQRALTAEQLKPLLLIIDPPLGALTLDGQPVHTEQLALVLSNLSRVELPGAWVITTGEAASGSQWLYLPCRPVAIQLFSQRSDMEAWLLRQALVPPGLPTDNVRFEYTAKTDPMGVGASDLFAACQPAQVSALRHATLDKPGLAEHGAQSLALADRVDQERDKTAILASPPNLETADGDTVAGEQPLFGSLYADIPLSLRRAALNKQRDALETLVAEVGDGQGLQPFKDSLKALETAEEAADKAASALLNRSRPLDVVTFQQAFTALHSAHKAGLHAEARLQLALKQLSDEECSLLKALLDTPDNPGPDPVAASLTLSMTEQSGDETTVTAQELNGAFIVTRADALTDANSPHSVLLYWSGTGGGLQRFANRRELERQVLQIHQQDNALTLQLNKIPGDALTYGLNQLTSDFEEQAGALRQRHAEPAKAAQRAEQLEILRKHARATLQVPVHAARNLAFAHLQEQDRSNILASNLPNWLSALTEADRTRLKRLIEAYITAMQRSHELLTVALEPRDDFTRKHLHARLRKDFSIKGRFDVKLDLPDSVKWAKHLDPAPGAPGTPQKLVLIPSVTRSRMSLEDLAQHNIDNTPSMNLEPLSLRLSFMQVEVTAANKTEAQALKSGITRDYLMRVLPELDLPKAYETLIRDAFTGAATESVFSKEHRRESLIEPWALMLKLQGETARLQKQIDQNDLQVLNIAIDADTPQAWRTDGKRIVLLPAHLSAGGKDTPNEGPVTLSGVNFIEEQVSGVTLLYLPDSPDGQFLRRYDSLETARKALFNLCLHDKWVSYLAGRALQGDVRAHEIRIKQSMLKHFDALIGVGLRWPATTSLAAHLVNAHMGRLIETHRGTSRANDALYMERYALKGPRAFNYIKMAFGLVPFVGTAISLYDVWIAANQAVAAFLRADVGDGLAEVESVLLSLIDAAMDLLPGEVAASALSRTARSVTRARQLHKLGTTAAAIQVPSMRQARHVAERFAGYEYEQPVSLSGLQPATQGTYRNIYRHAEGDFIVRQGRIFQVERSKDSRNWRLSGNSQKTYKQPIALDEAGHWDTYFGVYGVTFEGGGLGGGNMLGHLADTLDPVWPQALRERLPRWWSDHAYRRHHALTVEADRLALQFDTQVKRTKAALQAYNANPERPKALMREAETACIADIELAKQHYQTLADLFPLSHGNKKRALVQIQSDDAALLTDRYKQQLFFANHRIDPLLNSIDALIESLDTLPATALSDRLRVLGDIRKLRLETIKELDTIKAQMGDLNYWYEKITVKAHKAQLTQEVTMLNGRLSEANLLYLRTGNLLEMVTRYDTANDVSWFWLQSQAQVKRAQVDRALFTQFSLPEVNVTKAQRNQILQECIEYYSQFRRDMNAWTASYPQHFHLNDVPSLMDGIAKMAEKARKALDLPAPTIPGRSNKKVFTTEGDQLLIGVERWETTTQKRQYILTGRSGYMEIWEQGSNGKFRLLNPQPQPSHSIRRELEPLVADARHRLQSQATYQARVQAYADQDMLPVDLEHMMVSEANELTRRALGIEDIAPGNALVQQLRDKATELIATGRALRTRQSLLIKKPTDGMLDDLVTHHVVDIRKTSPIKNLGKRSNGRIDYMQEYEVWDLTQTPAKVLWYAHFHYNKAAPAFGAFEKAHLKLPEHRFLTHADNADLPYADIGKQSAALPHFENL